MKQLAELLKNMPAQVVKGDIKGLKVAGIAYDSRKVKPGAVFVCIEGFKTDGHNYIDSAVRNGAAAIVVQREVAVPEGVPLILAPDTRMALALLGAAFYDYPSRALTMIGVTGTNGKTTTTHLIEEILKENGKKVGLIGTIKNKIGDEELPVTNTTPESLDLQQLLAQMRDAGVSHVVMEVSSHALELGRVAGVEYDLGIFTNITQDHLDFHENMENYLAAKTKLFSGLGKNAGKKHSKYGIINVDDPQADKIIAQTTAKVLTYGINNKADLRAQNINLRAEGVSFDVVTPGGELHLALQITGLFNVANALAAVAAAVALGLPLDSVKTALEQVRGVAGRLEKVDAGQDFAVLVDYAHTPDSLENIIKAARGFTRGRIITVFGCGGDRDRTKRPIMGAVSARLSDYSVLTSDNPRSEEPLAILADIEAGVKPLIGDDQYAVIPDRREAISFALKMAEPQDTVLIAGKGHETYQIVGDRVLPFDDRATALELLRGIR
ncbi:MAG: UDP-N-acetylmuramoyl-L-alanyl-D-glutamate--2,6-diaminopimelate ligase [Bacillota bacterium]